MEDKPRFSLLYLVVAGWKLNVPLSTCAKPRMALDGWCALGFLKGFILASLLIVHMRRISQPLWCIY
jgi:hypothetical protein